MRMGFRRAEAIYDVPMAEAVAYRAWWVENTGFGGWERATPGYVAQQISKELNYGSTSFN